MTYLFVIKPGEVCQDIIVVEHKDRLTRIGFNYLQVLLAQSNRTIEVVNLTEDKTDDLMQDFVSIITSFCARLYSIRRRTRKITTIIRELGKNLPLQGNFLYLTPYSIHAIIRYRQKEI